MQNRHVLSVLTLAAYSLSASASVISDNFETNTSSDYTIVNDGTPNGAQTFAFDYVAAGIPLAPRSTVGDKGGLKMTANVSATAVDAWTVFHKTPVNASRYKMTVDVYMAFQGTTATTEYAHVGVGGNGTTFNSVFTPISGSGSFIAFTGDGGSASDYRWFRAADKTPVGDAASTTLPNSHPSYLGHGSNNTGAFYQSLFPDGTVAGSPGNLWTTLEIEVNKGTISYSFDGVLTFQGLYAGNMNGLVSLGYADPFTSVAPASVFGLFDNLEVVIVPEPTSLGFLAAGGAMLLRRRK